jgi:hypothetical protein
MYITAVAAIEKENRGYGCFVIKDKCHIKNWLT